MARRSSLTTRLQALAEATDLAEGRVDPAVIAGSRAVTARAHGRLAMTGDNTVVAVAGATGSGKSSTVNALAGAPVAEPGVRRPTTAHPVAVVFGDDPATELLDWLAIRSRHRLPRTGEVGPGPNARGPNAPGPNAPSPDSPAPHSRLPVPRTANTHDLSGLVLIDLPDHDSTEAAHRREVDRLVELVDVLVWVLDPQKYADAALHERYLVPLARHAEVMIILLNQVDALGPAERTAVFADLRALLDREGLDRVELLAVSATTGEGIATVRGRLAVHVAAKVAATKRIAHDVTAAASRLRESSGTSRAPSVTKASRQRLDTALATAAGVPLVVDAVGQAWRRRGGLATGWPVLAWVAKLRPDPLRRLHLDRWGLTGKKPEAIDPVRAGRSSLPATTSVERARVDSALRDLTDEATAGLPRGWADAVRDAARSHRDRLPDRLDRGIATTDLDLQRHRGWWEVVRVLQWLLVVAAVGGIAWLGLNLLLAYLQFPPLPDLRVYEIPVPSLLLVGGVGGGLVVAALSRIGVEIGARRRARLARRRLRAAIAAVTAELVIDPMTTELERHGQVQSLLGTAAE